MAKKKKKKRGRPQYKSGPKKGQFMSKRAISAKRASSKRKSKPKRKSTALAKRGKSTSMAKKKKRKGRRGNPNGRGLIADRDLMIGGAIYGFISKPQPEAESIAATFQEQTAKLPEIGNEDITNGLLLYFIDRYVWKNKWIRDTSRAALVTGAVRFGRRGFTLGDGGTGYEDALDVTDEGGKLSGIVD